MHLVIYVCRWLLQALRLLPVDPAQNVFSEAAEVKFFGFRPFGNLSQPDVPTATSRPVYAALNMFRNAAGNPQCGPVSAVLSRRYVGSQAVAAPVDTGLFYGTCGSGQQAGRVTPSSEICLRCDAWPSSTGRPLGVPGMLTHLVAPFLRFFNATAAVAGPEHYPHYNLARLLLRLLSRQTYRQPAERSRDPAATAVTNPLRLNFMENTWGYLELNPALTISQPEVMPTSHLLSPSLAFSRLLHTQMPRAVLSRAAHRRVATPALAGHCHDDRCLRPVVWKRKRDAVARLVHRARLAPRLVPQPPRLPLAVRCQHDRRWQLHSPAIDVRSRRRAGQLAPARPDCAAARARGAQHLEWQRLLVCRGRL